MFAGNLQVNSGEKCAKQN